MSNGDNYTFNAHAKDQAQIIQGQTAHGTQINNIAGASVDVAKFFEGLRKEFSSLPAEELEALEINSLNPLEELAQKDAVVADEGAGDVDGKVVVPSSTFQQYLGYLRPHAATIARYLAIFGAATLKSLTTSSVYVAGVAAIAEEYTKE